MDRQLAREFALDEELSVKGLAQRHGMTPAQVLKVLIKHGVVRFSCKAQQQMAEYQCQHWDAKESEVLTATRQESRKMFARMRSHLRWTYAGIPPRDERIQQATGYVQQVVSATLYQVQRRFKLCKADAQRAFNQAQASPKDCPLPSLTAESMAGGLSLQALRVPLSQIGAIV